MTATDPRRAPANNHENRKIDLISEIRDAWGWEGIDPLEVVGENGFGNPIIKDVDGNYWRMCPEDVYCKIANEIRLALGAGERNAKPE